MAKNVIITEDGHSKTISNTTRIRTALEGGGTCDWIPKDDVPLQELTVTEDGVYDPEEGYYGFSQVTANGVGTVVEGTLIEKSVTKNGTYNITDESGNPYGYSKITVNVDTSDDDSDGGSGGGGNPVVGKDDDGNDTMAEADDDGNIVMTALPTEIKVIIPPTKLEYNRYEEIDYSGISVYAYISKAIHSLGTTTTPVYVNSVNPVVQIGNKSVTASTGDSVLYAPDRTGVNDVRLVWDGNKWIEPENYSADKAIWKSDKYPTGKIPFEELIFPIKRLNSQSDEPGSAEVKTYNDNQVSLNTSVTLTHKHIMDPPGYAEATISVKNGFLLCSGSSIYVFATNADARATITMHGVNSVTRVDYTTRDVGVATYTTISGISSIHHHSGPGISDYGLTCSFSVRNGTYGVYEDSVSLPIYDLSADEIADIAELAKNGDYSKTYAIALPVQWKRPGDGKILEATFTAWMKDDGGNNNGGDD